MAATTVAGATTLKSRPALRRACSGGYEELDVSDVSSSVTVTGAGEDSRIETVNGDVNFEGAGASSLETVNGKVIGNFSRAAWEGSMKVETVNGSVRLTFSGGLRCRLERWDGEQQRPDRFPDHDRQGMGLEVVQGENWLRRPLAQDRDGERGDRAAGNGSLVDGPLLSLPASPPGSNVSIARQSFAHRRPNRGRADCC